MYVAKYAMNWEWLEGMPYPSPRYSRSIMQPPETAHVVRSIVPCDSPSNDDNSSARPSLVTYQWAEPA